MAADLVMDKATPQSVAVSVLNVVKAGKHEVFPDPVAEGFAGPYEAGAKTLERGTAEMLAGG